MANTQAPFGFRATRSINGAAPNYAMFPSRFIAQAYATAIGQGDVVVSLTTGYIALAPATATQINGIFQGCQFYDTSMQQWRFLNAFPTSQNSNADILAFTIPSVDQVFEVQSNAGVLTTSSVGLNATFIGNGAPNIAGISTAALDPTTASTTATLPFRIVGLGQGVSNDNTSSYNTVEVILNNCDFNSTTGV